MEDDETEAKAAERDSYRFPLSQESLEHMGWMMCVGMFGAKLGAFG